MNSIPEVLCDLYTRINFDLPPWLDTPHASFHYETAVTRISAGINHPNVINEHDGRRHHVLTDCCLRETVPEHTMSDWRGDQCRLTVRVVCCDRTRSSQGNLHVPAE